MTTSENFLDIVMRDVPNLKRVASTGGGEWAGPCPFCREGEDRFRVWPNEGIGRYYCRRCEHRGDAINYLVDIGQIDRKEAYEMRHGKTVYKEKRVMNTRKVDEKYSVPPSDQWQEYGWGFVDVSKECLWSDKGARALEWLHKRGLNDEIIRKAELGYNPKDTYESRVDWGLIPEKNKETGKQKRIWLPQGVVIPWIIKDQLWRINIRRPQNIKRGPKYCGPTGWSNGLYNADQLQPGKPAILVEGEFDALTILQEAGDLVIPVATGSTGGSRCTNWLKMLQKCSIVLVTFDADEAGEEARKHWLDILLSNGKYWRPYFGDVNAMHMKGANIRAFIEEGLGHL